MTAATQPLNFERLGVISVMRVGLAQHMTARATVRADEFAAHHGFVSNILRAYFQRIMSASFVCAAAFRIAFIPFVPFLARYVTAFAGAFTSFLSATKGAHDVLVRSLPLQFVFCKAWLTGVLVSVLHRAVAVEVGQRLVLLARRAAFHRDAFRKTVRPLLRAGTCLGYQHVRSAGRMNDKTCRCAIGTLDAMSIALRARGVNR